MQKKLYFYSLVICGVLLLTSCSTIPSSPKAFNQNFSWPQRKKELSRLQSWETRGAIALRTDEQRASIYFQWKQTDPNHYTIYLFGPLGLGAVTLFGSPGQVRLIDSHNHTITAKSPERLIQNSLGVTLPISALYYWIRGLPQPTASHHYRLDSYNHLSTLTQSNFNIHFLHYSGITNHDLPNKIILQSPRFFAKIVINEWKI